MLNGTLSGLIDMLNGLLDMLNELLDILNGMLDMLYGCETIAEFPKWKLPGSVKHRMFRHLCSPLFYCLFICPSSSSALSEQFPACPGLIPPLCPNRHLSFCVPLSSPAVLCPYKKQPSPLAPILAFSLLLVLSPPMKSSKLSKYAN